MIAWQEKAVRDNHLYKVFVCGRKARKTTCMVNELAYFAMTDERGLTYPYFAPFRRQAKNIVWDDHVARILRLCNQFGIKYQINLSELTIKFPNYSKLQIDGLDNAEAHRGKSDWGGGAIDEAASTRLKYVWEEIIRPNLQVHKAWWIFGGTPKGYDYFYQLAKLGDHENVIDDTPYPKDKLFMSFHATSYDNPFNDPEWLESTKQTTNPDYFRREYLAEFTRFSGLVYPEFNEQDHVLWFDHEFNEHGDYYFGLDFAVRGYTAALVGKVLTNGHIYILDEYKEQGETAQTHIEKIKEMFLKYADLDKFLGFADPSGWAKNQQRKDSDMLWSLADEYIEADIPLTKANNEVNGGINFTRQYFVNKKIHIHPRCEKLIEELYQYQWKELKEYQIGTVEEPEQVRKVNDHLVDCLRYLLFSKPPTPDELEKVRPAFPVKFELKLEVEDPNKDQYELIHIPSLYD